MRIFFNHIQLKDITMNQSIQPDYHSVSSLSLRRWDLMNIWDEVKINLPLWSLLVLLLVLSSFLSSLIPMSDWWDDFTLWWVCWSSSSSFYLMELDFSSPCDVIGVIVGLDQTNHSLPNIHNTRMSSCVKCVMNDEMTCFFVQCDYPHLPPSLWWYLTSLPMWCQWCDYRSWRPLNEDNDQSQPNDCFSISAGLRVTILVSHSRIIHNDQVWVYFTTHFHSFQ